MNLSIQGAKTDGNGYQRNRTISQLDTAGLLPSWKPQLMRGISDGNQYHPHYYSCLCGVPHGPIYSLVQCHDDFYALAQTLYRLSFGVRTARVTSQQKTALAHVLRHKVKK